MEEPQKKSNRILVFTVALAVIAAGVLVAIDAMQILPQASYPANISSQAASQTSQQVPGPGLPVHLSIPSVGIDADVMYVGLDQNGNVGVPNGPYQVAWYELGARPGQKGSAVIVGHFGPWKSGAHSVFDNLNKLQVGAQIIVKDDKGQTFTFTMTGSKIYNPADSAPEVFDKNDGTYLNLITCNGDWIAAQKTYTQRLVVFAKAA